MTFSIIGTGNIAWFLGNRLVTGRNHCVGVYGRNAAAVDKLSEQLLSDRHGRVSEIRDGDADICFLAVADTAIAEIAAKLSFKQTVLIHTAGAVDLEIIKSAAKDRAVLWPIYSISMSSLPPHRQIPCAWEASSEKAARYVQFMGHAVTDELFEAKYDQRKWLHLAAVIGNNFTNHMMAICAQICADNKIPFSALMPIVEQTFDRMKHASPASVQTGPAIRHDDTTIQKQIELLNSHPQWQRIYEAVTASIQEMGSGGTIASITEQPLA
jgi:predicted short-subunit dehydrogenase-like oxidoreductase (DUF2520 family)